MVEKNNKFYFQTSLGLMYISEDIYLLSDNLEHKIFQRHAILCESKGKIIKITPSNRGIYVTEIKGNINVFSKFQPINTTKFFSNFLKKMGNEDEPKNERDAWE